MQNIIKTVDCAQLVNNIITIKTDLNTTKLCAVVKSNAYGHGVEIVAKTIENYVDCFAVIDNIEALKLRRITTKPIIVLGVLNPHLLTQAVKATIGISVDNSHDLAYLERVASKAGIIASVNIQLDTGLHRLGTSSKLELNQMLDMITQSPHLALYSIYSHLGNGTDLFRTNNQITCFFKLIPPYSCPTIHLYNTYYYLHPSKFDMVRIGAGIYGYDHPKTKPILSIKAQIIKLVNVKKGEFIGYGNNHIAKSDQTVAILGIGYADGLPYAWAKEGWVLYNNKKCPYASDICMNMSLIYATPDMKVGEYVTILGSDKTNCITALDIAKHSHSIVDEILTRFGTLRTN